MVAKVDDEARWRLECNHADGDTVVQADHPREDGLDSTPGDPLAKSESADVIVVGTRGHTALVGLLLGSVTQRLLLIAPCPVLAVPGAEHGATA